MNGELTQEKYSALKEWHVEWSRLARFVTGGCLGGIAFSLTLLTFGSKTGQVAHLDVVLALASWSLLGLGAALGSVSLVASYFWLDGVTQVYLEDVHSRLGRLRDPPSASKLRRRGRIALISFNLSLGLLLAGMGTLVAIGMRRLLVLSI